MSEEEIRLKLGTFGEGRVGKTSLLRRFYDGNFSEHESPSIQNDIFEKDQFIEGVPVKVMLWDTAGQERYRKLVEQYFHGMQGLFLIYDITNRDTFDKISEWLEDIKDRCSIEEMGIVILGNKCDLKEKRQVTYEEGEELAKKLGHKFFETSACTGYGVEEAFNYLMNISVKYITEFGIRLKSKKKKKSCC